MGFEDFNGNSNTEGVEVESEDTSGLTEEDIKRAEEKSREYHERKGD